MKFFNSFRQHLYRFFTKEEKEDSMANQPVANQEVKKLMNKFGGHTDSSQNVSFFFYTDAEDKAANLAIELSKLGYEIFGIKDNSDNNEQWSVIGQTPPMPVEGEEFDFWSKRMVQLGFDCDCKFDGWETEMKMDEN
jgi:regulator of RNase E activity RraB